MADFLNAIAKKRQNSDSTFKVSPFQTRGFGVQQKSSASTPATKAELWENYQAAKQLTRKVANASITAPAQTQSLPIQAKLTIGKPGDKYEQEADSVAQQVMAMPETAQVQREELPEEELQTKPDESAIQREVVPEEEDESAVQMKLIGNLIQREELPEEELQTKPDENAIQREVASEEEDESVVQMKLIGNLIQREELPEEEIQTKQSPNLHDSIPTPSLENRLSSSKGGGSPLSDEVRSFMEPRFGADFSGVRVHTGSDAVQMNRDVNAQAFAHGQDVYFGAGKAPAKDDLTAHELTHVVQQTGASKLLPKRTQLVSKRGTEQINRWSVKKAFKAAVKKVTTGAKTVGSAVKQGAGKVQQGVKAAIKKVGAIFGPILDLQKTLVKVLAGAGSAIPKILKSPIAFAKSLFSGLGQGFKSFASQIQQHLKKGLQTFLLGSLGHLNLKLPKSFDTQGLLSIAAQLTGLSHDKIRAKAVGKLGEDKVSLIEQGASAVKTGNVAGFAKQQALNQLPPERQRQLQEANQMFQSEGANAIKSGNVAGFAQQQAVNQLSPEKQRQLQETNQTFHEQGGDAVKSGNVAGFAQQQALNQLPPEKQRQLQETNQTFHEQGGDAVKSGNVAGFAQQQALNQLPPEKQRQLQEAIQMFQALRGGAKGILQYFNNLDFGEMSKLVIDSLKTYLIEEVMVKGVTKIVVSLTPGAGWVLAAIDALRMMYGLFIERAQELKSLATGAVQSIVEAAQHNVGGVAQKLESSLGKSVPMLISIIGDYVGIGDIASKVKQFINRGGDWVNKNITPVVDRVLDKVAGLF